MKKMFYLLISVLIMSCSKDDGDDINYDMLRANIFGTWEVIQTTQEIRADTVYAESSRELEITFGDNGTGVRQSFLDTEINFDWFYQYNPEKVVIISKQEGLFLEDTQVYMVSKNEAEKQIWEFEVEDQARIADVFKHTWRMTKK